MQPKDNEDPSAIPSQNLEETKKDNASNNT